MAESTDNVLETLRAQIRALERTRTVDRTRLQEFERMKQDRDRHELIVSKLEAKIKPMYDAQQELRQNVRALEAEKIKVEELLQERTSEFELVTLDKEVAEQEVEELKEQLTELRLRLEEARLELETLKEERSLARLNDELPSTQMLDGQSVLDQNEILRDALIKLRDQSSSDLAALQIRLKKAERDAENLASLQEKYSQLQQQFEQSEEIAENLRQQLDIANGADEMLDELTVRNLNLSEQVDDMRATIQDLETLKGISDEIEASRLESEKQLQEEIGYRDILLHEQAERLAQIEETNAEYEYTVSRFRELVSVLQSELDQIRSEKSMEEAESAEINRRTREMFDLNQKLQAAALSSQAKTIDLELRKLEAQEATEYLSILKGFIPESLAAVREAIQALLCFRRITFKSSLISNTLKEYIAAEDEVNPSQSTEICDRLASLHAYACIFSSSMCICDTTEFEQFGLLLGDIVPIEEVLNECITQLRSNNDKQLRNDALSRINTGISLLAEIQALKLVGYLEVSGPVRSEEVDGLLFQLQSYTDGIVFVTSFLLRRVLAEFSIAATDTAERGDEHELGMSFEKQAEGIIAQSKGLKVLVSKAHGILKSWRDVSKSPSGEVVTRLGGVERSLRTVASYLRNVCFAVVARFNRDVESYQPCTYTEILAIMTQEIYNTSTATDTPNNGEFFFAGCPDTLKDMALQTREVTTIISSDDYAIDFATPTIEPWKAKVGEIRQQEAELKEDKARVARLTEEVKELSLQIHLKERALEESVIKMNVLNVRLSRSNERLGKLQDVESEVARRAELEKKLQQTVESLRGELEALTHETTMLRESVAENEGLAAQLQQLERRSLASNTDEMDAMAQQITALQSTIRYLQTTVEKSGHVEDALAFLEEPILPRFSSKLPSSNKAVVARVFDDLVDAVLGATSVEVSKEARRRWRRTHEQGRYQVAAQRALYEKLVRRVVAVQI
ncbi:dynein associated protein-domain-containing protein [Limtongia smithiae]|uniref:dynein associated protein-domain-containing protein n=1 Tax=Limtongia smithiae TaxID=1125753 RepID=UPI0034CD50C4